MKDDDGGCSECCIFAYLKIENGKREREKNELFIFVEYKSSYYVYYVGVGVYWIENRITEPNLNTFFSVSPTSSLFVCCSDLSHSPFDFIETHCVCVCVHNSVRRCSTHIIHCTQCEASDIDTREPRQFSNEMQTQANTQEMRARVGFSLQFLFFSGDFFSFFSFFCLVLHLQFIYFVLVAGYASANARQSSMYEFG